MYMHVYILSVYCIYVHPTSRSHTKRFLRTVTIAGVQTTCNWQCTSICPCLPFFGSSKQGSCLRCLHEVRRLNYKRGCIQKKHKKRTTEEWTLFMITLFGCTTNCTIPCAIPSLYLDTIMAMAPHEQNRSHGCVMTSICEFSFQNQNHFDLSGLWGGHAPRQCLVFPR